MSVLVLALKNGPRLDQVAILVKALAQSGEPYGKNARGLDRAPSKLVVLHSVVRDHLLCTQKAMQLFQIPNGRCTGALVAFVLVGVLDPHTKPVKKANVAKAMV